ncbi:MAG: FtsX-like permease family protein [Gemmatimonadetes bacterium]|nr:FtsX-like permease family protein [Gemmatimonadota bacterium]
MYLSPVIRTFSLLIQLVAQSGGDPRSPGIAVEARLAGRWGISVGDTIAIAAEAAGPAQQRVVEAIYRGRADPATALRGELAVRFHLADLANLLGAPDRVDRIGVAVRPGIGPDSAAARINQIGFGFRAYPSATIASESSQTFLVVSRFHQAIGFIAIVASAVFLLCIMLLKVEERRLDAAVMRMIGLARRTVFLAFLLEATLLASVGAALGAALAYLATVLTNLFYQRKFETTLVFAHLTPDIVLLAAALSLVLGIGAGALAAARLLGATPLALWRRA